MNTIAKILIPVFALTAFAASVSTTEPKWELPPETARFKPGPGAQLVTAYCLICHSADYIAMQPPLDRAGWNAIVLKMREKYGAPVPPMHTNLVVDYLVQQYGKASK